MAQPRLTPIQRDALLFLAAMTVLLVAVAAAVAWGVSFTGPARGIAPWAVAALGAAVAFFAAVVWYWYNVFPDEREPARGEFTRSGGRTRHGKGSWRTKALKEGALREPGAHVQDAEGAEPEVFPRTSALQPEQATRGAHLGGAAPPEPAPRRAPGHPLLLLLAVAGAVAAGALMAGYARTAEDPLAPALGGALLLAGLLVLVALFAGDRGERARP